MHNNAVCINKKENALPNEYLIEINSIHHSQNWCLNSLITPVYFIFFVLIGQFVLSNTKSAASIKIQLYSIITGYLSECGHSRADEAAGGR